MIAAIAQKELRELVRDGRVRLAMAALVFIAMAALIVGADKQRALQEEQREAEVRSRAQWEALGSRNPHTAAHFGMYVNVTHDALSLIDPGLTPYVGRSVWIEAHNQNPLKYRPIEDAPAIARFGDLTAALVLQQLVPLFLILLAYGSFAMERERGTLRVLLASNVSRLALLAGKLAGIMLAAAMVLGPVAVAVCVVVLAASNNRADDAQWLAVLAGGYGLYYALVLVTTVAVSAAARSSRAALTTCLALWVVTTLLVPKLAADLAERAFPPPPAATFWSEVDAALANPHGDDASKHELERKTMAAYGVSRLEDLPVNFEGIALQASEEHGNAVFDAHYGALFETYERQARLHELAALVSPLMSLKAMSMAIAATDVTSYRRFATAAESYRRLVQRTLNDYITQHPKRDAYGLVADANLWRSLPAFAFDNARSTHAVATSLRCGQWLAGWLVAMSMVAFVFVRRMSPL